jgi:hypothetical protein
MNNALTKENGDFLLRLVRKIVRESGNDWFKDSLLAELLSTGTEEIGSSDWVKKIGLIETYLRLDGIELIDYSEILNPKVRAQLICDNIEMSRYRFGKIDHRVNFGEFCRYAHLQVEELINYLFNAKFAANLDAFKAFIIENSRLNTESDHDKISKIQSARKIDEVDHSRKFESFKNSLPDFPDKKDFAFTIYKLNSVRNRLSHRSTLSLLSEEEIIKQVKEKDLARRSFGNLTREEMDLKNEYELIKFIKYTDFEKVVRYLVLLKDYVVYLTKE